MEICNIGAERLLIAIYTCVCSDLVVAYKHSENATREGDRLAAKHDAARLEKWILDDPYGFLPDPEGILKEVKRRYKMGARSVKCPDFAKEGGKTLRKMEYREIRMSILQVSR